MLKILVDGSFRDKQGNKIIAPVGLKNIFVCFHGSDNLVIINEYTRNLSDLFIEFIGSNGVALIGNCTLKGHVRVGNKSKFIVGDQVTSTNSIYATCAEATNIIIGDDCMFATNNQIRTDDAHAIFDVESGKRINSSKDINIGAHVWVAYNAVIFGGSQINTGSIIGFNSIVKGVFPNNCTLAGSPATIKKNNVTWDRSNILWSKDRLLKNADSVPDKIYWDKTDPKLPLFFGDGCSYLLSFIYPDISYLESNIFFSLDYFKLKDHLLFMKGNAFIRGLNCYHYGNNYRYILYFKNSKEEFKIELAKENDNLITKKVFDGKHFSYQKSKFTTSKNAGINLLNFASGIYELTFILIANKETININLSEHTTIEKINNSSQSHSIFLEGGKLKLKIKH